MELFDAVRDDLPSENRLVVEVHQWIRYWSGVQERGGELPKSLNATLKLCSAETFPNIRTALVLLLTLPVSTATAERSFSVLRRLKTYLRSTMRQDRLVAVTPPLP